MIHAGRHSLGPNLLLGKHGRNSSLRNSGLNLGESEPGHLRLGESAKVAI